MDNASRQTALFFGFLTAAMTAASAQAAPAHPTTAQAAAVHGAVSTRDQNRVETLRPILAAKPAAGRETPRD